MRLLPEVLFFCGVIDDVMCGVEEENVLRLEIGVGQTVVVHKLNCITELVGHLPDLGMEKKDFSD